jgi:RNA polymerase sigma factor (sigma-70 family)
MDSSWVAILEDDIAAARDLEQTLRREGLATRTYTSIHEFLTRPEPAAPGCVVAKLIAAETSGLELQRELATRESNVPVVFITAGDALAATVKAMRAGAVSCLQAPVRGPDLVAAVREGLSREAALRAERAARRQVSALIDRLTAREQEVLKLVVAGLPTKQIAFQLGAAEKTVKVHRWRLMRKLRVRTSIDLVRLLAAGGNYSAVLPQGRSDALLHGSR